MYSRAKEITNPEKGRIQVEQKPKTQQKASVVYYLSRNGKLEHPHFIEVPLSSPRLYLRGKCLNDMFVYTIMECMNEN